MNQPQQPNRTLILGMGKTGLSIASFLAARGESFDVMDSREQPPSLAEFARLFEQARLYSGGFDERVLESISRIIVSPGIALSHAFFRQAAERGIEVMGDVELFARYVQAPVVAITGSNGKSTVTSLLGEMARCAGIPVAVGGNLGEPALSLLQDDRQLYVLELSSFQLETTRSLRPAAAVVLNISPDHLDRHVSLHAYKTAKQAVYRQAAVCLCNRQDEQASALAGHCNRSFGSDASADQFGLVERQEKIWLARGAQALLKVNDLKLQGAHNHTNVLAALALGEAVGLPMDAMLQAARNFAPLPHRCQYVVECHQVRYIDDSKATNVGAVVAALKGLAASSKGRILLIAGGEAKENDFSELVAATRQYCRRVILIGRDAPLLAQAIDRELSHLSASLEAAVKQAAAEAKAQDVVLLSPACASFDMFENYQQRGDCFAAAARAVCA
ncbi:MAG: UDP-N-acetylmuramoyl-L-alanine--D-glutamate ligase [gamma proteobacterium symbiont of Bathyaustriella thionipta]|nr:UDP-N-acetylmuramoyl-L-alanine--D-glutamate ligase [gamma proteobacterium symbiont of Bathyaustriella thionipta]